VKKEPQAPRGFLCFRRPKEMTMMKETMVKKEPTPEVKKEKLWWEKLKL
jgi:hypothetical protein